MGQKINALYKIVTVPILYEAIQNMLGRKKAFRFLANGPLKTKPGDRVLDVGCGPATLREYLGDIEYTGMDLNAPHIEQAKANYGHNSQFFCGNAVTEIDKAPGPYDLIICIGLLHHLDDDAATNLLDSLSLRLAPKGRIVTYDPVYIDKQNFIAKKLNDLDSGQNIRTPEGYKGLFNIKSVDLKTDVLSGMLNVPYNHCCNIATKAA